MGSCHELIGRTGAGGTAEIGVDEMSSGLVLTPQTPAIANRPLGVSPGRTGSRGAKPSGDMAATDPMAAPMNSADTVVDSLANMLFWYNAMTYRWLGT